MGVPTLRAMLVGYCFYGSLVGGVDVWMGKAWDNGRGGGGVVV